MVEMTSLKLLDVQCNDLKSLPDGLQRDGLQLEADPEATGALVPKRTRPKTPAKSPQKKKPKKQ